MKTCGEISAFFTEIFFQISFVIFDSTLHSQIFAFDISIQILDLILDSTYMYAEKEKFWRQKWHVNSKFFYCYTRYKVE